MEKLARVLQIWGLNAKVTLSTGSTLTTDCVSISEQPDCIANCHGGRLPIKGCPINGRRIIDHWANSTDIVFKTSAEQLDEQLIDATCCPIDISHTEQVFKSAESNNK